MKATQKQFEIISGILDLGLSKIEAGGNDLQGFLEECSQFATSCRDTYALWLLLKIGRAHKYPAGDSWAFNDELEEAGPTLNDAHMLTAMKHWLKGKLEERSPLTFNSYEAIKAGKTTEAQSLEGLEGFLNIIVDALETEDPSLTIERAGFGERWPLICYLVSMEPAGTVSLPRGYQYFSLSVEDEIRISVLDEDGAPVYSVPLMLQAEGTTLPKAQSVSIELGRRAFLGAEWTPYAPEHGGGA